MPDSIPQNNRDRALVKDHSNWVAWAGSCSGALEQPCWYYRGALDPALLLHLRRGVQSEMDALDFVESWGFDRNFAVRFFPRVYCEACRYWPFFKVHLPLGRVAADTQRELYECVRAGLTLEELDAALLGDGPLGAALRERGTRRPTIDERQPGFAGHAGRLALFPLDAPDVEGRPPDYCGPAPRVDALFDHLDRADFLDRFPLIKLNHTGFCKLAIAQPLRSWQVWVDDVRRYARRLAPDMPPLGSRPFLGVVPREAREARRELGFAAARIADAYRAAIEQLLADQKWAALLAATAELPIDQRILEPVRSFAENQADRPQDDEP